MNSYADNNKENKKQPAAVPIQRKDTGTVGLPLADTHPSIADQLQLQEIANNSPQVKQALQLQAMANANSALPVQKKRNEEEEVLQDKIDPIPKKANKTGLPDTLKSGIENLSHYSMDDVKVHYNSDKPAQLQAHAYAQGTDIHLASGQEKHLPHEAWHVVQQKQGRVKPTLQMKGYINVNDDPGLENEADLMGNEAMQAYNQNATFQRQSLDQQHNVSSIAQLEEIESTAVITTNMAWGLIQSVLVKEMADIRWVSIITPLLKAGDTLIVNKVSDWTGLAALVPGINYIITASKVALGVWDIIPDTIKTGILYLIGVLTANAPILGRYDSLQGLIVKGDEGEVREKLQGWVNTAKSAVNYFTQPLSSLYRFLTGSSEDVVVAPTTSEGTIPSKEETEKLINLNLQVITLMMNNLKLGYDSQEEETAPKGKEETKTAAPKKTPGLIVEFFVQLHLFNHNLPERKGGGMDRLFFPFSGEFKYRAGSPIVINSSDKTILGNTLGPVSIFPLEVAKSGVKEAGLNIDKLIIGNGIVILTAAKGTIKNKLVTLSTEAQVNIAGHSIGGAMELQLNDGHFKSLAVKNVNNEGNYKLKEFKINDTYSGKTVIEIDKLDILKGTLSAENIKASADVENKKLKSFNFTMNKFLLDFWGSNVNITGAQLAYVGADPEKDIKENISGGAKEIDANIHGVNLNLKDLSVNTKEDKYEFSSGKVKFNDFEILVEKASLHNGGIQITKATLSIPKYQIEGSVNSFSWNSNGLDFESLSLALPGKTISPIEQVQLSNISVLISKNEGYRVTLTSDINVSPNGGTSLLGATAAQLTLSKEEIAGTLKELKINTAMFEVLVKNAEFNKERIGAEEAGISFKSREEGNGYSSMLPSFDTGLLDFIKPDIALKAKDAYFNKGKGFSIGSVSPSINAFTINLFGVEATVNPEEQSITIKSSFTFPGTVPPAWPFSMNVPFPIFIGVSGNFGIELGGGVTLHFDAKAKRDKGKNKPYIFEAHPGIKGDLFLKISAGVELGARLAIALQANLYAQAGLNISTTADLTGALLYSDSKLEQSDPLKMLYELKSAITAEVGGEIRVKAFLFYDKQLTKVKFKDWTLGEWTKSGQFGSLPDGKRSEDTKEGGFGNAITEPTMSHEILEGEKAEKLLLSANERIIGSGAKRKELISSLTIDVSKLASQLLLKHQVIKREFDDSMNKLMQIILRKDVFYRKNFGTDNITALLSTFDNKNNLEAKKDEIRAKGAILDNYETELKKILDLMNDVESGLDIVGLEDGVGSKKETIDSESNQTKSIEEDMKTLSPPTINLQNLNSELNKMGADALSVSVSSSIMTLEKFIEISTTKGALGGENIRKRVKVIDDTLQTYNTVRAGAKSVQIPILENLLEKLRVYIDFNFSSRTQAALLLQYQVEQALEKLKRS
jgi:hypothetical protein